MQFAGTVLGHEIAGVIEEFGPEADPKEHGLQVGDFVVVFPWIGCEKCDTCVAGKTNQCAQNPLMFNSFGCGPIHLGGYASHVLSHRLDILVKVTDEIPRAIAAMIPCSGLTSFNALNRAKPYLEDGAARRGGPARLLVAGSGGLGLWATQLVKYLLAPCAVEVTAADVMEEKLDTAKKFGADFTVLWKKDFENIQDYLAEVQKTTRNGSYQFDAAIDFVGFANCFNLAYRSLRVGGTIVAVGLAADKVELPLGELIAREAHIQGNMVGTNAQMKALIEILKQNTPTYPALEFSSLDDVNASLDKLKKGQVSGRVLLAFE